MFDMIKVSRTFIQKYASKLADLCSPYQENAEFAKYCLTSKLHTFSGVHLLKCCFHSTDSLWESFVHLISPVINKGENGVVVLEYRAILDRRIRPEGFSLQLHRGTSLTCCCQTRSFSVCDCEMQLLVLEYQQLMLSTLWIDAVLGCMLTSSHGKRDTLQFLKLEEKQL